jgi:hypothetical protein
MEYGYNELTRSQTKPNRRVYPALALTAGYLFGIACVSATLWAMLKSWSTAIKFSLIPAGFLLPVVIVFTIASAWPTGDRRRADTARRPTDLAIAVCYMFAMVPFWFAAVGLLEGRFAMGLGLLAVYLLMAAVPLHRLLRLRLAHNGSYDHESSEADDGNGPEIQ